MKIKITENEKERILSLHKNFKDNTQGIITESLDSDTMTAVNKCAVNAGLDIVIDGAIFQIPWPCTQWMIAQGFGDKSAATTKGKECYGVTKDILMGPDTEKGVKLMKLFVDEAIDFKACLEKKGVDVAAVLETQIPS